MYMTDIILYGGSFNPPHISHLLFATSQRAFFPDAEVWIAPTYSHAFHKSLMPFDLRLRMLHAMFEDIRGIKISTIERDLHESTSYTIDVVRALKQQNPDAVIHIAVGADIVPTLPQWREYEALCSLAEFLIFPREGYDNTMAVSIPHLPEISSSEIRDCMERGDYETVRRFVPRRVLDILQEYALKPCQSHD